MDGLPGGQAATVSARLESAMRARRLAAWLPPQRNLNAAIAADGDLTVRRAREVVLGNALATNAADEFVANAVGTGIKPSPLLDDAAAKQAIQQLWLAWTDEADADGFTDFYGLQRRAAREVFIAGEVFFRFRPRRPQDGLTAPLQLQMLPSEMLPLSRNEALPGGTVIRQGIEFDRIGRRVAYHFLRRHPGDVTDPGPALELSRQASELARQEALASYLASRYRVSAAATRDLVSGAYRAAEVTNLDPLLILAVMAVESSFNPIAESAYGAKGLMQVVPRYHLERLAFHGGAETVLDPQTNIRVGAEILSDYIRRAGSLEAGLQLYGGATADADAQYAQKVLAEKRRMSQAAKAPAPVAGVPPKPGA